MLSYIKRGKKKKLVSAILWELQAPWWLSLSPTSVPQDLPDRGAPFCSPQRNFLRVLSGSKSPVFMTLLHLHDLPLRKRRFFLFYRRDSGGSEKLRDPATGTQVTGAKVRIKTCWIPRRVYFAIIWPFSLFLWALGSKSSCQPLRAQAYVLSYH